MPLDYSQLMLLATGPILPASALGSADHSTSFSYDDLAHFTISSTSVLNIVDSRFKSWNIDGSLQRQWDTRNLADRTLRSLARQSLPGYLRFGGTGNDHLNYARDMNNKSSPGNNCVCKGECSAELCMNRTQFDNLHGFAESAGAKLVFGLAMPSPEGGVVKWDSTDARALITYAISSNKSIFAFELGNEKCAVFTADEAAANFAELSKLLAELYPDEASRPKIIGPDTSSFHVPFGESEGDDRSHESKFRHLDADQRLQYLVDFARNCTKLGVRLHAFTHHEYIEVPQYPVTPINGNATLLDYTGRIAEHVNHTLATKAPGVQIWAGEIGPHNGHTPGCTHGGRWANWGNTFWYLDAMASKAANGYSAFCRQDFVGIDYGMLDCVTHAPLPDYYGGVLWSKLMGQRVLNVLGSAPSGGRSVRAYAHCAANNTGAVTVLLLNIATTGATVSLGDLGGSAQQHRSEWHLTGPQGTNASLVALNGVTLQYSIDSSSGEALLPDLGGRVVARVPGEVDVVEMAPASIVFVQVSGGAAAAALCT